MATVDTYFSWRRTSLRAEEYGQVWRSLRPATTWTPGGIRRRHAWAWAPEPCWKRLSRWRSPQRCSLCTGWGRRYNRTQNVTVAVCQIHRSIYWHVECEQDAAVIRNTRWLKSDRDWFVCKQAAYVPVIFEPPCIYLYSRNFILSPPVSRQK